MTSGTAATKSRLQVHVSVYAYVCNTPKGQWILGRREGEKNEDLESNFKFSELRRVPTDVFKEDLLYVSLLDLTHCLERA